MSEVVTNLNDSEFYAVFSALQEGNVNWMLDTCSSNFELRDGIFIFNGKKFRYIEYYEYPISLEILDS